MFLKILRLVGLLTSIWFFKIIKFWKSAAFLRGTETKVKVCCKLVVLFTYSVKKNVVEFKKVFVTSHYFTVKSKSLKLNEMKPVFYSMDPELTRAVGRESCPTGGAFLRQQLEAGGGAEAEEQQEERSGAGQHDVSQGWRCWRCWRWVRFRCWRGSGLFLRPVLTCYFYQSWPIRARLEPAVYSWGH